MKTVISDISKTIKSYCADLEKNRNAQENMNRQNLKIIQSFPYVKRLLKENQRLVIYLTLLKSQLIQNIYYPHRCSIKNAEIAIKIQKLKVLYLHY